MMSLMHEFYFESAAMILTLITVGKMLEAYSKGKTTDALKSLMNLAPKNATLIKDGKEIVVAVADVEINDIFVVKPGESVPVDAVIIEEKRLLTSLHLQVRVFLLIRLSAIRYRVQRLISRAISSAVQLLSARIQHFRKLLKW